MLFAFDHTYARLPDLFHAHVLPTPVAAPRLLALNVKLASELGLDPNILDTPEGLAVFAGNHIPEQAQPIALAYSGHQFGHFNPQLGDGRAILLGEIVTPSGARRDIQLKGAGPTPYSRRGDGRAALGPVLREYIVSEAMQALGIPTTRTLAAVATGEFVFRDEALPGAVLTRVAASHMRVGTFEFFASRGEREALITLADYAIKRHDPDLAEAPDKYEQLLTRIVERQAHLIAQWMLVGFIHGVMNTDNMAISGETIDYGPCAFMEAYHPSTVFSFIDRQGRYAYANQPSIAQWNLARLAECLMMIFETEADAPERANAALARFRPVFQDAYLNGLRRKLGLQQAQENDAELISDLFTRMADNEADFTLTFRRLCTAAEDATADAGVATLFKDPLSFAGWAQNWRARLASEGQDPQARAAQMRRVNPAFIPRNHRVEQAIAAALQDDLSVFQTLNRVLENPYEDQPAFQEYMQPATADERVTQTFCGT